MKTLTAKSVTFSSILLGALLFPLTIAFGQSSSLLLQDYPSSYIVKEDDTIRTVAGQFLVDPGNWSDLWMPSPIQGSDASINPGDIIEVEFIEGRPKLISKRGGVIVERLSPQMREIALLGSIPAIPLNSIQSSFTTNRIVPGEMFDSAPYIVSPISSNLIIGTGDEVYARGSWPSNGELFEIYRQINSFPGSGGDGSLGIELETVGYARVVSIEADDLKKLVINSSKREILVGDRLLIREDLRLDSTIYPSEPSSDIDGQIIAMTNTERVASQLDTVLINVGARENLVMGNILDIHQPGPQIVDTTTGENKGFFQRVLGLGTEKMMEMPSRSIGSLLIYKVFDNMSYGVILTSTEPMRIGDLAVNP